MKVENEMKKNVLIFPANANALEIYHSLKYNVHFDVYGASAVIDHSSFVIPSDRLYVSKQLYITDDTFFDVFNEIIEKWNIEYIIPSHDTIAFFLMKNQEKIPAVVVCSPAKTAEIAEDKKLTYEYLKNEEYYPKVYSPNDSIQYPVFLKPYVAAGGKGTVKVHNVDELKRELQKRDDLLICEYLPGEEYTIDCFTNREGELLFAGARTRERITNGITFRSERIELTEEISSIAQDLNSKF